MIERERLVREAEVHGAETAAAVRERRKTLRIGDERWERGVRHEARDLARARLAQLRATGLDDPEVEVDELGEVHRPANALLSESVGSASGGVASCAGVSPTRSAIGWSAARSKS